MASSKYRTKKKRATKKRSRRESKSAAPKKKRKKRVVRAKTAVKRRAVKKKKRARVIKRSATKRRVVKAKSAAKRRVVKKRSTKAKAKKPAVKKRSTKAKAKKPAVKKRSTKAKAKKPAVKKRSAKAKVKAAKPKRKKPTLAARRKRIEAELTKIRELQKKARGKSKRSPEKKEIKKRRAKIDKEIEKAKEQALPKGRTAEEIEELLEEQAKRLLHRRNELLDLANELGQTRPIPKPPRTINTKQRSGINRIVRINRWMETEEIVLQIVERIRRVAVEMQTSANHRNWNIELAFSAIGADTAKYNVMLLDANDLDAISFQASFRDQTGIEYSLERLLMRLQTLLNELFDGPGMTYVHSALISYWTWL